MATYVNQATAQNSGFTPLKNQKAGQMSVAGAPSLGSKTPKMASSSLGGAQLYQGMLQKAAKNKKASPPNPMNDINAFYQNMLNQQDQQWQGQQGMLQDQASSYQRRADAMNAAMGRGLGGGYASLQGAALGQGMNEMQKAYLANQEQRMGIQQNYFNAQTQERQREQERAWQQADQAKKAQENIMNQIIAMTGEVPSSGMLQTMNQNMAANGYSY